MDRIEKIIANNSSYTRSQIKALLKAKKIKVNGEIITSSIKVSNLDEIYIDETKLEINKFHYILLNKPAGYVCANSDQINLTVFDYLKSLGLNLNFNKLHTVGRLDKDTTGILLITDDGEYAHQLVNGKKHVAKVYDVLVDLPLKDELIQAFENGVDIGENELTKSAKLTILSEYFCQLEIKEGKYHQVKRMFSKFGYTVKSLHRSVFGPYRLVDNNLKNGEFILLNNKEKNF
ncbi:pseudouridine synthase [Mycoplasma corogypsi]|uniref:pseudouridine synthase n=1 Tax=Mycoplasma corogypsi TaxID=2106 RepID=UPI0038732E21